MVRLDTSNTTFDSGADAHLMCHVTGDTKSNIDIAWQKDGLGLPYDDRYKETERGELLIEDLVPTDAGTFTCIATRGGDKVKASATIKVNGKWLGAIQTLKNK